MSSGAELIMEPDNPFLLLCSNVDGQTHNLTVLKVAEKGSGLKSIDAGENSGKA